MRPKSIGSHLVTLHNILSGVSIAFVALIEWAIISEIHADGMWICDKHGIDDINTAMAVLICSASSLLLWSASGIWLTRLRGRAFLSVTFQASAALLLSGAAVYVWYVYWPLEFGLPTPLAVFPAASTSVAAWVWKRYRTGQLR